MKPHLELHARERSEQVTPNKSFPRFKLVKLYCGYLRDSITTIAATVMGVYHAFRQIIIEVNVT